MHLRRAFQGPPARLWLLLIVSASPCVSAYGNPKAESGKRVTAVVVDAAKNKGASAKAATESAKVAPPLPLENARIDDIDVPHAAITIMDCPWKSDGVVTKRCIGPVTTPTAKDTVQAELKNLHKGDHVSVGFETQNLVKTIVIRSLPVDWGTISLALAVAFAICFALTALLTGGHPLQLIIGEDGRYSNSKFQMAIWFVVVIATYLATVYLRVAQAGWEFFGGVNIPTNLLLLSGMSALTFGGAKGITTLKVQTATEAGIPNPKPPGQANLFKDFVQNDAGKFDIGDFQMLVVTFVAVGMYLTAVFHSLGLIESWKMFGLPNVDTTILATFGLGQGAYLTKKAVGEVRTS